MFVLSLKTNTSLLASRIVILRSQLISFRFILAASLVGCSKGYMAGYMVKQLASCALDSSLLTRSNMLLGKQACAV
ncbi:hypothetical protein EI94DRAFT_1734220, partial [Lactarius quietus]